MIAKSLQVSGVLLELKEQPIAQLVIVLWILVSPLLITAVVYHPSMLHWKRSEELKGE